MLWSLTSDRTGEGPRKWSSFSAATFWTTPQTPQFVHVQGKGKIYPVLVIHLPPRKTADRGRPLRVDQRGYVSAAEEFAYNFKSMERAVIIGENNRRRRARQQVRHSHRQVHDEPALCAGRQPHHKYQLGGGRRGARFQGIPRRGPGNSSGPGRQERCRRKKTRHISRHTTSGTATSIRPPSTP